MPLHSIEAWQFLWALILPGCGEVEGDVARNKEKQDDCSECVHAGHGDGIAEDIEKGVGGGIAQCVIVRRDAKYVGYRRIKPMKPLNT